MKKTSATLAIAALLSVAAPAVEISWDVAAEASGVTEATFRRSSEIGNVSSFDYNFHAIGSAQLDSSFLLRFGIELQRFDFDVPTAAPLPNNLEALGLVLGADFQVGDAWLFRIDLHPGLYSANSDIDFDDFNMPITMGGSYFLGADVQLIFGIGIDWNRKYPVLPAAGIRWKFARSWVFNGILPRPRLEYLASENVTIYAGSDLRGGTYRVDDEFGNSREVEKLNNAFVSYTQIRVGAGVSSKINSNVSMEFEAGCVVHDEFDFHRAEYGLRSQDTPFYARAGFQVQF